jgi:hypothetical protein
MIVYTFILKYKDPDPNYYICLELTRPPGLSARLVGLRLAYTWPNATGIYKPSVNLRAPGRAFKFSWLDMCDYLNNNVDRTDPHSERVRYIICSDDRHERLFEEKCYV